MTFSVESNMDFACYKGIIKLIYIYTHIYIFVGLVI